MKYTETMVIDRSRWVTGTHGGESTLLNNRKQMCCLGFRCHQMGIPYTKLKDVGTPSGLRGLYNIPDLINVKGNDTDFSNKAIQINDDHIPDKLRESKLKELFATIGIRLIFEGKFKDKSRYKQ